ncbi:MAG: hypothetical protein WDM85_14260 [Caulobacteraceae bacterium]
MADLDGRAAAVKQLSGAFRQPSGQAHTDIDRMVLGEPATRRWPRRRPIRRW